jgi:hypothetical protein
MLKSYFFEGGWGAEGSVADYGHPGVQLEMTRLLFGRIVDSERIRVWLPKFGD